jgi:hypothetical protein
MTNKTKLILTLFILTILSFFEWTELIGIELRSHILAEISYSLFFIFVTLLLGTIFYFTMKNFNGTWHLLIVFGVPLLFIFICFFGLLVIPRPVYWQDTTTFKNKNRDNEFLIYQTFGFGFAGDHLKGRFIVTSHKDNKVFRPINIKSNSLIPTEIGDLCNYSYDSIPKSITVDNDTYDLIDTQE